MTRLSVARELLTGDVRDDTKLSLYGFLVEHYSGNVWVVSEPEPEAEAPVDYIAVDRFSSAADLLEHLEALRQGHDVDADSEVQT